MNAFQCQVAGASIPVRAYSALVIGSGAAGFSAALRLHQLGVTDIAVITEGVNSGTSRNTGSDKQTYYKLTLSGDVPDSPMAMAQDLFRGKCVDGDIALTEAALSARCFLNLCELGVPFPTNAYGEYIGYKTDHDPRTRATSAGPLTSKLMTERLEAAVRAREIPIFDGYPVISLLKDGQRTCGALALNKAGLDNESTRFAAFLAPSIVYATGGPAGVYADSVYPTCHFGASGAAFEAGARGRNLTEWQYGLASVSPRWNVSGTYMQVLPRLVSVDDQGVEREFLLEYFGDEGRALTNLFLKGFEWPLDSRKALTGSSVIDLLVYRERMQRGRRVYLDYRQNPFGQGALDYDALGTEAHDYLQKADACFGTPIERLLKMNRPAYELYLHKGVDLQTEMLEISLCAQHMNGGLDIDPWWRTGVPGLYAAGEVAGSHGVYRPGGSALNAGQVGALRAAQHIAARGDRTVPESLPKNAADIIEKHIALCKALTKGKDTVQELTSKHTRKMSEAASALRNETEMKQALREVNNLLAEFPEKAGVAGASALPDAYRLRDALITQKMMLTAMLDYAATGGGSRGAALYHAPNGIAPEGLGDAFRFKPDDGALDGKTQLVALSPDGQAETVWRDVRPLPDGGGFFENIWREFRENKGVWEL